MPEDAYDPAAARSLEGMPMPRLRPAGFVEDRYPVEDGPGSGRRVELTVRVLVGTERSTVIVDDPITGLALVHRVVPHGAEADAAAAAVGALLRDGIAALQGDPGVDDLQRQVADEDAGRPPFAW